LSRLKRKYPPFSSKLYSSQIRGRAEIRKPDPLSVTTKYQVAGSKLRYLLARTPGFDLALLEESEGLLVKHLLGTGVLTTPEAFVLVGWGLLLYHHHLGTSSRLL